MSGVSSQFPQIGADLSAFMNNVQPFLQGASQIQPSMMDGVKALAETVLILTAADILQGLTSCLQEDRLYLSSERNLYRLAKL